MVPFVAACAAASPTLRLQRAVENLSLFGYDSIRSEVLAHMPAMEVKKQGEKDKSKPAAAAPAATPTREFGAPGAGAAPKIASGGGGGGIMDDLLGLGAAPVTSVKPAAAAASAGQVCQCPTAIAVRPLCRLLTAP